MYAIDPANGDIVITGFDKGIGDSPYSGLTDLKSVEVSGIPGEASVNFSTQSVIQTPTYAGLTLTALGGSGIAAQATGLTSNSFIEVGQAVTVTNSTFSGMTTGTVYYVEAAAKVNATTENLQFTLAYGSTSILTIGSTGTATLAVPGPSQPKFITSMGYGATGTNFMLDASGRLWSDVVRTSGGTGGITSTSSWTYAGNTVSPTYSDANGNGLVYWRTANATTTGDWDGWLFIFRDGAIDYMQVNQVNNGNASTAIGNGGTFTYGWNPVSGATGQSNYLIGRNVTACPHYAIMAPDGRLYFTDRYNIQKLFQTDISTPVSFLPGTPSTYTYTTYNLLPIQDVGTCLSPLGTTMLIGGRFNQAYNWDRTSNLVTNPVLLPESYVARIVTINTNAYIFCGNRGNIYITNGSQANFYKKVPDHISGTVQPYFTWGDVTYQKKRLYFGVYAVDNSGTALSGYGGVWTIDTETNAMWLSNQLSYGSYGGYATALFPIPPLPVFSSGLATQPAGVGLLIGWNNSSTYGLDSTISTPYTGGQSYVISDAIPIGTAIQPITPQQVEWKTAVPLVSGESVQILISPGLNSSYVSAGTTTGTVASAIYSMPDQAYQWILVKGILTSTASSPSYARLTQIRLKGVPGI